MWHAYRCLHGNLAGGAWRTNTTGCEVAVPKYQIPPSLPSSISVSLLS